jgi:uncharacterized protein YkwD
MKVRARFVGLSWWLALVLVGCSSADREAGTCDACSGATDCFALCLCQSNDEQRCLSSCSGSQNLTPPTDWPNSWQNLEQELRASVNEARAHGGCCEDASCFEPSQPLEESPELTRAAREHAADMATRQYFAHDSPEGTTAFDRMRAMGFRGCAMGENLAEGQMTADDVVDGWLNSPAHCQNLLDPTFRQMGAGYADSAGALGPFWVQSLGD